MNKFLLMLTLGTLFFLLTVPLSAQGRSDQAPGQMKKEEVSQVSPGQQKKALIGTVEDVTSDSVVVEEKKTKKKTEAVVDATTQLVGQDRKALKIGSVKLKNLIALISSESATATAGGKLKIKKIFVKEASESAQMKRRAVAGVITNINGNVLTLTHQIQRDRTYTVLVTPNTLIKIKSPEATKSASLNEATGSGNLSSLAVGQRIVAIGDLNPDGGIIAKHIHVIPGKATGIFKRLPVATPSASLKASPSVTPSVTASASATPLASP